MNREKIIRRAEETARKLRRARAWGNTDPLCKEAENAIMALLGVLRGRADVPKPDAEGITITKPWGNSGWVTGTMMGGLLGSTKRYSFAAKVYGAPSALYGINGGRVSKLAIYKEEPTRHCVLNYDRRWDIEPVDEADKAVFRTVMDYLEALPVPGEEAGDHGSGSPHI